MSPQQDPNDFSAKYNTTIPPERQSDFDSWAKGQRAKGKDPEKDRYDYDVNGFFLSGAATAANGHGSDQFKKPNHPTFSDESQWHGIDGYVGGRWSDKGYVPSQTNLGFRPKPELQQYFNDTEPDTALLPADPVPAPTGHGGKYRISDLSPGQYRARPRPQPPAIVTPASVITGARRLFGR